MMVVVPIAEKAMKSQAIRFASCLLPILVLSGCAPVFGESLPLHLFVTHKLEEPAVAIEEDDPDEALRLLKTIVPTRPHEKYEIAYLKALALEQNGEFESSLEQFRIAKMASDVHLSYRAGVGMAYLRIHQRKIDDSLLTFPAGVPSYDMPRW